MQINWEKHRAKIGLLQQLPVTTIAWSEITSLKEKKIMAKPVQQSVVQKVGKNFLDCELSVTRHCPALEQPWPTVQETQKSSQNIKSNIFSVEFNKLWQE